MPVANLESRESVINWLCWNDPNGDYTDEASDREGLPRLTLEEAVELYHSQQEQ